MAGTKYIIQWTANPSFCAGVTQAAPNQPVVLTLLQGAGNPLTQWYFDSTTGQIALVADPTLVFDISGTTPGNEVPVIVAPYVLGRPYQSWNWLGRPGWIMNNGAPGYYLDDFQCIAAPGNKLQIFDSTGGCQNWTLLAVPSLVASGIAEAEDTGVLAAT